MPRLIDAKKLVPKHFVQRTDKIIGYAGTHPIYEYTDVIAYDIDNAPTVEAIPKEWIRTWARKMTAETDNFNWGVYTLIMLEDWEKENAKID